MYLLLEAQHPKSYSARLSLSAESYDEYRQSYQRRSQERSPSQVPPPAIDDSQSESDQCETSYPEMRDQKFEMNSDQQFDRRNSSE